MFFIDKNGHEIVTICELFERKKFIKAFNNNYYFFDNNCKEMEVWTFIENLYGYIPMNTPKEFIEELVNYNGWCKKIN